MYLIKLNQRTARMLRDNLVNNQDGYDYLDLCRLDALAKKLTALQGDYATRIADLTRQEKQIRRQIIRAGTPAELESANKELLAIAYESEDLHEAAEGVEVELRVEDGDYKLIGDKLAAVGRWTGTDTLRHLVISMIEAIRNAEQEDTDGKVRKLREV